jgi:hypothetical protein
MPTKVYIPNKSGHNYKDAERYGELVFITAGVQNKYSVNHMVRIWQEVIKDSSPEDCIVLTGLNIICAIGCAVFARKHGRINLLIWRNERYIKREEILEDI